MSDPNFSSVTLLAKYESDFADISNAAQTATTHGPPTIVSSTPSPPTGASASAKFVQASSQYVDYGTSTTMDPGAGDFTAEAWFNLASLHSYNSIVTKGDQINAPTNLGWGIWIDAAGTVIGLAYDGSSRVNIQAGTASTSTWYHCALVRASGTWSLFFNGNRLGTSANATGTISNSTRKMCVGADDSGSAAGDFLNGDVGYARVTPGVARYSGATYTIPTIPTSYVGTINSKSLAVSCTTTTSPSRSTGKIEAVACTTTTTRLKAVTKGLAIACVSAVAAIKSAAHSIAVSCSSSTAAVRIARKILAVASTTSTSIAVLKERVLVLAVSCTTSVSRISTVAKRLAVSCVTSIPNSLISGVLNPIRRVKASLQKLRTKPPSLTQ